MRRRLFRAGGVRVAVAAALLAIVSSACAYVEQVNLSSDEVAGDSDVVGRVAISGDGRYVTFAQGGTPLVAGVPAAGYVHVYVRDLATGATEIIDVSDAGDAGTGTALYPAISADGRYVAYESTATNLVAGDTNASTDVFVRDRTAGTTTRVSVATDGTEGDDDSEEPSISADGNRVAFSSYAENLVGDDYNSAQDIFVRDRTAGTTVRASVKSNGNEGDEEEDNYESAISADGNTVAFVTYEPFASDDLNEEEDVYVRELATSKTRLVSRRNSGTVPADGGFGPPDISADGRYVAFISSANLDGGVAPITLEIFVRDRTAGTTIRASKAADGTKSNGPSFVPSISADGRYVAFRSGGSNLIVGDTNGYDDVFVRDTVENTTTLASRALFLAQVAGHSYTGAISDDGNMVAFTTPALVQSLSGDTTDNGKIDVYARYYRTPTITSVSPKKIPRGTATNITISGSGFEPGAVPSMADGIVVGKVVVVSATEITARARVPAGFAKGNAVIRVKIPGPSWNTDNGATAECTDCVKVT
ncbi:MAG: IPT/TIG domain-containing protein [Acidimicrobiia bacterium]|nr:IPT/TIG domain-containing protein [Acidimicrobiia bacterium]